MQTKWQSLVESCVQTLVAFTISTLIQPIILHQYNCYLNYTMSMQVAVIFTAVSFVRGYIVRRGFNFLHIRRIW